MNKNVSESRLLFAEGVFSLFVAGTVGAATSVLTRSTQYIGAISLHTGIPVALNLLMTSPLASRKVLSNDLRPIVFIGGMFACACTLSAFTRIEYITSCALAAMGWAGWKIISISVDVLFRRAVHIIQSPLQKEHIPKRQIKKESATDEMHKKLDTLLDKVQQSHQEGKETEELNLSYLTLAKSLKKLVQMYTQKSNENLLMLSDHLKKLETIIKKGNTQNRELEGHVIQIRHAIGKHDEI